MLNKQQQNLTVNKERPNKGLKTQQKLSKTKLSLRSTKTLNSI